MARKEDGIDILKLYSGHYPLLKDTKAWNAWLTKCLNEDKLNELVRFRYGLQVGMAKLKKNNLDTEKIVETWCRWIGSIDKTIRRIVKRREMYANDQVKKDHHSDKQLKSKRDRDSNLEKWLRKNSY